MFSRLAYGPGEPVGIRADSDWDVPEPELAVVADRRGRIAGYLNGNDMWSRSIEGERPGELRNVVEVVGARRPERGG
jgi:fumarylacetoacetate (FAA) hydrolase family protein